MNLASLSTAQLRKHLSLQEKIVSLQEELGRVESEIIMLLDGKTPAKPVKVAAKVKAKTVPVPAKPTKTAKAGKPQEKLFEKGALRIEVLKFLKKAGKAGASVDDIANAIGTKKLNVSVWFTRNSKKIKGIHKLRRSVYALKAGK